MADKNIKTAGAGRSVDELPVIIDSRIKEISVGFGWTAYAREKGLKGRLKGRKQVAADCDGAAFFCGADGNVISPQLNECCAYYGNRRLFNGAALHGGDNSTGISDGDDETIIIDLDGMPARVVRIVLVLNLFKDREDPGVSRTLEDVFIRVTDARTDELVVRLGIPSDALDSKAVAGAVLERTSGGWQFRPTLNEITRAESLEDLAAAYGA